VAGAAGWVWQFIWAQDKRWL